MGNGGNWGIGGVGKLHDIFHQVLICPVDRLYDSPIYTDIERFGGVSRVFGLAVSARYFHGNVNMAYRLVI